MQLGCKVRLKLCLQPSCKGLFVPLSINKNETMTKRLLIIVAITAIAILGFSLLSDNTAVAHGHADEEHVDVASGHADL